MGEETTMDPTLEWDEQFVDFSADMNVFDQAPMRTGHIGPLRHENGYEFKILDERSFIKARESYKNGNPIPTDFPERLDGRWGQHHYIRHLFSAMTDMRNVTDTNGFIASFLRICPSDAIELACWEVFIAARDVQRWGRLSPSRHKYKIEHYDSFHARVMAIAECCRGSKAFCKSMMEPSRIFRAAQNPYAEINGKKVNSQLNIRKSGIHKLGQVLVRAEGRVFDEETRQWIQPKNPQGAHSQSNHATIQAVSAVSETAPRRLKRKRASYLEEGSRHVKNVKLLKVSGTIISKPEATATRKNAQYRKNAGNTLAMLQNVRNLDFLDFENSTRATFLCDNYRQRLCTLLGVPFDARACPFLHELRLYAYSVNEDTTGPGNQRWCHDCFPSGWHGAGLTVADGLGDPKVEHFAQLPSFHRLRPLATSRGDLHADGTWSINIFQRTLNTHAMRDDQMVCGLVDNHFGLLDPFHMENVCNFCPEFKDRDGDT